MLVTFPYVPGEVLAPNIGAALQCCSISMQLKLPLKVSFPAPCCEVGGTQAHMCDVYTSTRMHPTVPSK